MVRFDAQLRCFQQVCQKDDLRPCQLPGPDPVRHTDQQAPSLTIKKTGLFPCTTALLPTGVSKFDLRSCQLPKELYAPASCPPSASPKLQHKRSKNMKRYSSSRYNCIAYSRCAKRRFTLLPAVHHQRLSSLNIREARTYVCPSWFVSMHNRLASISINNCVASSRCVRGRLMLRPAVLHQRVSIRKARACINQVPFDAQLRCFKQVCQRVILSCCQLSTTNKFRAST